MKHQLCRNCGHRHALGAPCRLHDAEIGMLIEGVGRSDTTTPVTPEGKIETESIPEKFERMAAERGFKKLTPAQKQKAYRERGDVTAKREANKLRMRRSREK